VYTPPGLSIGVARGCTWVHVHTPMAEKKIGGQICRGKLLVHPRQSVHPYALFEEIGESWTVGVVNLVVLACVLGKEKCTPEKILATLMVTPKTK